MSSFCWINRLEDHYCCILGDVNLDWWRILVWGLQVNWRWIWMLRGGEAFRFQWRLYVGHRWHWSFHLHSWIVICKLSALKAIDERILGSIEGILSQTWSRLYLLHVMEVKVVVIRYHLVVASCIELVRLWDIVGDVIISSRQTPVNFASRSSDIGSLTLYTPLVESLVIHPTPPIETGRVEICFARSPRRCVASNRVIKSMHPVS